MPRFFFHHFIFFFQLSVSQHSPGPSPGASLSLILLPHVTALLAPLLLCIHALRRLLARERKTTPLALLRRHQCSPEIFDRSSLSRLLLTLSPPSLRSKQSHHSMLSALVAAMANAARSSSSSMMTISSSPSSKIAMATLARRFSASAAAPRRSASLLPGSSSLRARAMPFALRAYAADAALVS